MVNQSRLFKTIAAVSAVAIGLIGGTAVQAQGRAIPARTIKDLDAPGGLIVHVGADDAARTAALNQSGSFLLHFLYTDADAAQKASSVAVECNLAGKVTVSVFDGHGEPVDC